MVDDDVACPHCGTVNSIRELDNRQTGSHASFSVKDGVIDAVSFCHDQTFDAEHECFECTHCVRPVSLPEDVIAEANYY